MHGRGPVLKAQVTYNISEDCHERNFALELTFFLKLSGVDFNLFVIGYVMTERLCRNSFGMS